MYKHHCGFVCLPAGVCFSLLSQRGVKLKEPAALSLKTGLGQTAYRAAIYISHCRCLSERKGERDIKLRNCSSLSLCVCVSSII